MKKKNTYNPEDLEDLLLNKSFDELLESEQEFVLQHIDSIKEYNELRNTLLSIKDYSKNNEQIIAEPKVKEELLELFEKENKKAFWFLNLNSIGAFLFPKNTPVFRKPAFQVATCAVLAFFTINIGNNLSDSTNNELAKNDQTITEQFKEVEKKEIKLKEENYKYREDDKKSITPTPIQNKIEKPTDIKSITLADEISESTTIEEEKVNSIVGNTSKEKFRNKVYYDTTVLIMSDYNGATANVTSAKDANITTENSLSIASYDLDEEIVESDEIVTVRTNSNASSKLFKGTTNTSLKTSKEEYNNSQSLENSEDLIDLLYIAM